MNDIICFDDIETKDINIQKTELFFTYENLCLEYYFNIKYNLSNNQIKEKLKNNLKKNSKEWIKLYFEQYTNDIKKDIISKYIDLSFFDIQNSNNIFNIIENNKKSFGNIYFDKLLFILKESINSNNTYKFINKYFIIIKLILENIINKKNKRRFYSNDSDDSDVDSEDYYRGNNNNNNKKQKIINNFVELFAYNVMKIMYEYLIDNYTKENKELFIQCFTENNINELMKNLIENKIDMNNYFDEKDNKKIKKKTTLLIQLSFKYLDFCLLLFFRENKIDLFEFWMKNRNKLYTFYCNYKLLSTEKYYEKNDFKEIFSLIAYISDSINCFNVEEKNTTGGDICEIKFNDFKKYIANIEEKEFYTLFDIDNSTTNDVKYSYKKLAIFYRDENNKSEEKYILQDIIDINEIKRKKIPYKIKLKNEFYLTPLNDVKTYLYAFGYNYNHSLGVNGNLSKFYDTPTKCNEKSQEIIKYSWNMSYGQNYCFVYNEENNKVYACGCGKGAGFNSTPRKEFSDTTNVNQVNGKIVDFATGNCNTSLILNEKGQVYAIGENEDNFLKLQNFDKNTLKLPKLIQIIENIKVVSMSISYKNCYVIDESGRLFGIGDNSRSQVDKDPDEEVTQWTIIPLPKDCKRFLQCANGERYLICLVEDEKGKGRLYAKGDNTCNECGIKKSEKFFIKELVQCDETYNLNFKSIYTRNNRSAAITTSGDIYVWGKRCGLNNNSGIKKNNNHYFLNEEDEKEKNLENIKCPNLVEHDKKYENVIFDQVAISNTHILAIGRALENGNYVKKLFSCGNNKKGALGVKIDSFSNIYISEKLSEVKLINKEDEKSKLVPIKISVGNHRSFVLCVDENEIINQINNKENSCESIFNIKINHFIEENIVETITNFYKSENLYKFINLFRSLTYPCFSGFVDAIDKMKTENNISTSHIYYNEFLSYLYNQNKVHDLFYIFDMSKNDIILKESESIYNYLKTRIMIIENNILKYCWSNLRSISKNFLQKIIGNNISYITNEIRVQRYNDLLLQIPRYNGEIKRINVDRFKAKAKSFYDKYNDNHKKITDFELDETIFGQVFHAMEDVDSKEYFLYKDKRLFIVCLQGEHASDQGGPYHEVISNICNELQSDYIDLLIKTPNNKNEYGLLNDKYIVNPNANRNIHNRAYEFIGKLMASSISSGEALDLNLHPCIWKCLLGNKITFYDYESIDYYFYDLITKLEDILKMADNKKEKEKEDDKNVNKIIEDNIKDNDLDNIIESYDLTFVIKNSNDVEIELKPNGNNIKVDKDNLKEYIELCKEKRIKEFNNQIEYIKKGFNSVISYDILQLLNWSQLEEMVCGKNILDIDDFKKNTTYEGFNNNDNIINWFWEWFEGTEEKYRIMYLKFVSGRSRLQKSDLGFRYRHIISKALQYEKNSFPKSTTCFFKLNLPLYDSKEIFVEKMKYAIINCSEIDTDI